MTPKTDSYSRSRSKSNTGAGEMTRRAFLSSKNNTGAGEIVIKKASQNFQELGQKIEDISKSVNSIGRGAIFLSRLGHELSRNGLVVSVYAF